MSGFAGIGMASNGVTTCPTPFPYAFGLVEPDHDGPIILSGASRAERDVPCASTAHCTVNSVVGRGDGVLASLTAVGPRAEALPLRTVLRMLERAAVMAHLARVH